VYVSLYKSWTHPSFTDKKQTQKNKKTKKQKKQKSSFFGNKEKMVVFYFCFF